MYSRDLNGKLIRSLEVAAWCMPNMYKFANSFYVSIRGTNYTVSQTARFLSEKFPVEFEPLMYNWKRIEQPTFEFPNVTVYNLYGTNVKTEVSYFFDKIDSGDDVIKHEPNRLGYDGNGDGDQPFADNSAVNEAWGKYKAFSFKEFPGLTHVNELGEDALHKELAVIIKKQQELDK